MKQVPKEVENSDPEVAATPKETMASLFNQSGSGGNTKVRQLFAQLPVGVDDRIGKLAGFVTNRKRRALQFYLFLLAVWPAISKRNRPVPAAAWARALSAAGGRKWGPTTVSDALKYLRKEGLIETKRSARGVFIVPRREDGAADYESPGRTKGHYDSYIVLPRSFWLDGWYERLSMPELAVLIILAVRTNQDDETWLTHEDAAAWFGISPKSIQNGLDGLRKHGLVHRREEWVKSPLSAMGKVPKFFYSLTGDFSTTARQHMQAEMAGEMKARMKAVGASAEEAEGGAVT